MLRRGFASHTLNTPTWGPPPERRSDRDAHTCARPQVDLACTRG